MLDTLMDCASAMDWVTPTISGIRDLANGTAFTFLVPVECGWSPRDIRRMLRAHGVRVWGLMVVGRTILLTVRRAQTRWAEYLLRRAGVPIEFGCPPEFLRFRGRTDRSGVPGFLIALDDLIDDVESSLGL